MLTSAKTGACYTGLNGATVLPEVRAISGFALAPPIRVLCFKTIAISQSRVLGTEAI
jgi:hypothetical protein